MGCRVLGGRAQPFRKLVGLSTLRDVGGLWDVRGAGPEGKRIRSRTNAGGGRDSSRADLFAFDATRLEAGFLLPSQVRCLSGMLPKPMGNEWKPSAKRHEGKLWRRSAPGMSTRPNREGEDPQRVHRGVRPLSQARDSVAEPAGRSVSGRGGRERMYHDEAVKVALILIWGAAARRQMNCASSTSNPASVTNTRFSIWTKISACN
jgi:hypothetical protein